MENSNVESLPIAQEPTQKQKWYEPASKFGLWTGVIGCLLIGIIICIATPVVGVGVLDFCGLALHAFIGGLICIPFSILKLFYKNQRDAEMTIKTASVVFVVCVASFLWINGYMWRQLTKYTPEGIYYANIVAEEQGDLNDIYIYMTNEDQAAMKPVIMAEKKKMIANDPQAEALTEFRVFTMLAQAVPATVRKTPDTGAKVENVEIDQAGTNATLTVRMPNKKTKVIKMVKGGGDVDAKNRWRIHEDPENRYLKYWYEKYNQETKKP